MTSQIIDDLSLLGIRASKGNKIFFAGRGKDNLSRFFIRSQSIPRGECSAVPYTTRLDKPSSINIHPSGDVEISCGILAGNAKKNSLLEVLDNFDWKQDRLASILVEQGPHGLLQLPDALDFLDHRSLRHEHDSCSSAIFPDGLPLCCAACSARCRPWR